MKLQITYKGFDKNDKKNLKKFIAEKAGDLEHKLGDLIRTDTTLRGTLEKHQKIPLYRLGLTLHLPKKDIAGEEENEDVREVINKVFSELERQGQKYKSRLKNHHLWKRKARRKQLTTLPLSDAASQPVAIDQKTQQQASDWFDSIRDYLDDLYDFSVREITYLQAIDDLTPADILPDELVDETIVTAFEKQDDKPQDFDTKSWLFKLALDILDQAVQESQQNRQAISLETTVPEDDIDTQIYEFYQPEEVLKLEDLIPVPSEPAVTEENIAQQRELQSSLVKLPKNWRRASILHNQLGFSVPQIAAILALETAVVESLLNMTEQFISDHAAQKSQGVGFSVKTVLHSVKKSNYRPDLFTELEHKFKG